MNYETASRIASGLESVRGQLNDMLVEIQQMCSPAEFDKYRLPFAKVMGDLLLEIATPIYQEHPTLVPPELSDRNYGKE